MKQDQEDSTLNIKDQMMVHTRQNANTVSDLLGNMYGKSVGQSCRSLTFVTSDIQVTFLPLLLQKLVFLWAVQFVHPFL